MIYVLVQDSDMSDDDPGRMIFASADKYLVESKYNELVAHRQRLNEIATSYQEDYRKLCSDFPPPPKPNYAELPPRDLVWHDVFGWQNAYDIEHAEEYRKYRHMLDEQERILQEKYAKKYSVPLDNMIGIRYVYNSYSIQEVEDNPAADIRVL